MTSAGGPGPADAFRNAPRRNRYTWMPNGWFRTTTLGPTSGGTEFLTIGCPDDFLAVRVGFANVTTDAYTIAGIKACASDSWNDYFNPTGSSAWTSLTFAMRGADDDRIVTVQGAPTTITVAGNVTDPATGEAGNPAWTWTDWVPLGSVGFDPRTNMRVLMLRALVPSGQIVTSTNGSLSEYFRTPLTMGYDHFIGGLKQNYDRVSDPRTTQGSAIQAPLLQANRLFNGQVMACVQLLTRNPGVVFTTTGDSHHMGSSTTASFTSYMLRAATALGQRHAGTIPIGLSNHAVGGLTSQQFFPRLHAMLPAIRPGVVVLPGWTYNEKNGPAHADAAATTIFHARLMQAADAVRATGAVPVFLTPFPRNAASMTETQLGPWRRLRRDILAMRETGAVVLDAASVLGRVSNGALDGTYLAEMSKDGMHPNDAGHAAVASALLPILKRVAALP